MQQGAETLLKKMCDSLLKFGGCDCKGTGRPLGNGHSKVSYCQEGKWNLSEDSNMVHWCHTESGKEFGRER